MFQEVRTGTEVIRIYYVVRFPPGRCIIAVLVPSLDKTLGKIRKEGEVHLEGCHFSPCVLNLGFGEGVYQRCVYRLEHVRPGQYDLMAQHANKLARWVKKRFDMATTEVVTSSFPDLETAHRVLKTCEE